MSSENVLQKVCCGKNPQLDVVFFHGLTGDPKETWSCEENGEFWPIWLVDDIPYVNIYTVGYSASIFSRWAKKEMDLFERASNILEHMAGMSFGQRPIAFVAHSLGGILTKQVLRRASDSPDADYKKIAQSTKLIIFLATPHLGSSLANALDLIPGTSSHISLLSNVTGYLEDLNQHYRDYISGNPEVRTAAYYEKFKTHKSLLIVDRTSADPGVARTQPVPLDKDHISICKPKDRDDVVYLAVKRHVTNLSSAICTTPSEHEDYSVKSDTDRRDLLNKLIDADREHEYGYANEAQNKFARKLAKTGLFTSARRDHDTLLTEIQTRFYLHIYHPLICKDAEDSVITSTLQTQLVDPLANKKLGETSFSSKDIISALYYLTEQCHIRWDPE